MITKIVYYISFLVTVPQLLHPCGIPLWPYFLLRGSCNKLLALCLSLSSSFPCLFTASLMGFLWKFKILYYLLFSISQLFTLAATFSSRPCPWKTSVFIFNLCGGLLFCSENRLILLFLRRTNCCFFLPPSFFFFCFFLPSFSPSLSPFFINLFIEIITD